MSGRRLTGVVKYVRHSNVAVLTYRSNKLFGRLKAYKHVTKSVRARFDKVALDVTAGDIVVVEEGPPISRSLCWVVLSKIGD